MNVKRKYKITLAELVLLCEGNDNVVEHFNNVCVSVCAHSQLSDFPFADSYGKEDLLSLKRMCCVSAVRFAGRKISRPITLDMLAETHRVEVKQKKL